MDIAGLIRAQSDRLAAGCLDVLRRGFPHKLDHLMLDAEDNPRPAQVHPVFCGCYDWHSSVHMHWSLLRLREVVADPAVRAQIERHFEAHFTVELVARERAYAAEPGRAAFERPYGWAWLLKLQAELDARAAEGPAPSAWASALRPFAREVAGRLADFLPRSRYPVRSGAHANSAFAMLLSRDYAVQASDARLLESIDATARAWFSADEAFPARYEPGGADFLSPGLCEALLMSRVLREAFTGWWERFDRAGEAMEQWRTPVVVADRSDPQLGHLDGLNLSRAWCLAALAAEVPSGQRDLLRSAAAAHWNAAWPHVAAGDFTATHWLPSFAMLCAEPTTSHRPTRRP